MVYDWLHISPDLLVGLFIYLLVCLFLLLFISLQTEDGHIWIWPNSWQQPALLFELWWHWFCRHVNNLKIIHIYNTILLLKNYFPHSNLYYCYCSWVFWCTLFDTSHNHLLTSNKITPKWSLLHKIHTTCSSHWISSLFLDEATCCETLGERFENALRVLFSSWGSLCVRQPLTVILASVVLVTICSAGLCYMRITTNPVELWSSPSSRARQEKNYFDQHFGPFFRTEQLIITTSSNESDSFSPTTGPDIYFSPILNILLLHQASQHVVQVELWGSATYGTMLQLIKIKYICCKYF